MRFSQSSIVALLAPAVAGRFVEEHENARDTVQLQADPTEYYIVEFAPGNISRVTEEEKWELKRVCTASSFNFWDLVLEYPFSQTFANLAAVLSTEWATFHGHY